MIQYLTLGQVLFLHLRLIEQSGGTSGIRDQKALDSALAQPKMTFDSKDLYPSLPEKELSEACIFSAHHILKPNL